MGIYLAIGIFSVLALLAILIAIFPSSKMVRLLALVMLLISVAAATWIAYIALHPLILE